MRALSRVLYTLSLLIVAAPGWAADPAPAGRAKSSPEVIYHNYCSVCHGDRGDGRSRARNSLNPPPRDFTTPAASRELSRDTMITIITHGKPGTAMTAWRTQLTEQQIAAVTDYIRANFMHASALSQHPGKPLYDRNCAACHGDNGRAALQARPGAGKPPRDFGDPASATALTRERMINAVRSGVPGTAMAGFGTKMATPEIESVVDYVRAAFMLPAVPGISGTSAHGAAPKAAAPPAATGMTLPFPEKLTGNAAKGRGFYNANCANCHGNKGDGQGPRAYFIVPKPRVFTDAAARATLNRPALYAAISAGRVGTDMPAWRTVLSAQEIADVAEYVFQQFIQAPAAAAPAPAK